MRRPSIVLLAALAGCAASPEPRAPADRAALGWDSARGIRSLHVEARTAGTAAFSLLVVGGRLAEGEGEGDAAHLLEHSVLFTARDDLSVAEAFDSAGGLAWGETTDSWIAFHGAAPEETLDALLALLLGALRAPDLGPAEFARTSSVVAIETGRAPRAKVDGVRNYHERVTRPAGTLLVRVGSRPPALGPELGPPALPPPAADQPLRAGTWPAPPPGHPDHPAVQIAKEMVAAGIGSTTAPRYEMAGGRWMIAIRDGAHAGEAIERLASGAVDPDRAATVGRAYFADRIERWRDPAAFSADLGVAALYGDARTLLDLPARVGRIGPEELAATARRYFLEGEAPPPSPERAWEWEATENAPLSSSPRRVAAPATPALARPSVLVERPAGAYPEGERRVLARALFRELVLSRGIAYAPWAAIRGDRIVAGAWTSPEHVEEVATVLARRGRVRILSASGETDTLRPRFR